MATQMATTRQPFAPLTSSRLQNITSLKNRQNALSSPSKRKATTFDSDNDTENIDPVAFLSAKRSKQPDGTYAASSKDVLCKPTNYILTRAPPSSGFSVKTTQGHTAHRRPILDARSPLGSRSETKVPLSAPAGRSPTRKRIGILNRRKTVSPFTRVDPPRFSSSPSGIGVGFSIDAALSGTIPSYSSRQDPVAAASVPRPPTEQLSIPVLHTDAARESWFFEIHEDTEEELATNLMEHGACTLDISSDEESAARERESCGKENVPPGDDVSQTRVAHSTPAASGHLKEASETKRSRKGRVQGENSIELDRAPLGDLAAEDFYAEGCDRSAIVIVAEDERTQDQEQVNVAHEVGVASTFDITAEAVGKGRGVEVNVCVETLMAKTGGAPQARLLEPVDKVEEGWSVWESGSAKGDD
ncbi:hypothetical protein BUE80_DR005958 [Diplocarpon rosae]|nr:hypothetical protein BUE80_DR005958 [Diplocarpon rosae]